MRRVVLFYAQSVFYYVSNVAWYAGCPPGPGQRHQWFAVSFIGYTHMIIWTINFDKAVDL